MTGAVAGSTPVTGWRIVRLEPDAGAGGHDIAGTVDWLAAATTPTLIILVADRIGEELAGLIAARTGAALLGRATRIAFEDGTLVVHRSGFGGRIELETRNSGGGLCVATMRQPAEDLAFPAVEARRIAAAEPMLALDRLALAERKTALEGARIVVSGGRGLDAAGFAQLAEIAELSGGALGGSLPAVDLGLVPVARQVGQSGKFVTPALYLAVGISGTPQHLAGIGMASRIVAINKDPDAAIFAFAETGIVGDARDVLPLLISALAERLCR